MGGIDAPLSTIVDEDCEHVALIKRGSSHPKARPDSFIEGVATKFIFRRWGGQVAAAIMPPERRARRSETCSARLLPWPWLLPPPTHLQPSTQALHGGSE
jgi:hypothetical protein